MHRIDRIRDEIAQEAARLIFEEGVKEYRDAKRKAARRFGRHKTVPLGSHLPSNAEVHAELVQLIERYEGELLPELLPELLLQLRSLALQYLELFKPFRPLLVGSVLKGAVRAVRDDDPTRNARSRKARLSHRDLIQLLQKSLVTDIRFGIY